MSYIEAIPDEKEPEGCSGVLAAWVGAAGLSWFSPTFYKRVANQPALYALLFLFMYGFILTIFNLFSLYMTFVSDLSTNDIRIPQITIQNGVASADVPQPYVMLDEAGVMMVIDTTGVITRIDERQYSQGILMTRTQVHILDGGDYEITELNELHQVFGNPIVLDQSLRQTIFLILGVILLLWHTIVRMFYVLIISLITWAIVSAVRGRTDYGPVLSVAVYALIPAGVAYYLFGVLGLSFAFLFTFLYALTLVAACTFAFRRGKATDGGFGALIGSDERPLRVWRAAIAIPFFVLAVAQASFQLPWFAVWPIAFLTLALMLAVSALTLLDDEPDRGTSPSRG